MEKVNKPETESHSSNTTSIRDYQINRAKAYIHDNYKDYNSEAPLAVCIIQDLLSIIKRMELEDMKRRRKNE